MTSTSRFSPGMAARARRSSTVSCLFCNSRSGGISAPRISPASSGIATSGFCLPNWSAYTLRAIWYSQGRKLPPG